MLFIHVFGGHAVAKSSVVGEISNIDGVWTLGKYVDSKTGSNKTGGADPLSMTNKERFEEIRKAWLSSNKVVVVEGMIITYYKSFFEKYKELGKEKNRRCYFIYLYSDLEVVYERVAERSGGKEMNEKRKENLIGKDAHARRLYEKLAAEGSGTVLKFDTSTPEMIESVGKVLKGIVRMST